MDTIKSLEIPSSVRRGSIKVSTFKSLDTPNRDNSASVFAKPSSERTEEDIREAIRILKEVPFYASLQKEEEEMDKLLTETLNAIECQTFNQGDIVFHQTDEVAEFYVIIEGTVDIYASKTKEEMDDEIFQMENEQKTKSSDFLELRKATRTPRRSLFVPSIAMSSPDEIVVPQFYPKKTCNSTKNMRASIGMKSNTVNSLLGLQDCFQMHQGQLLFRLKNRRTLGPGNHFGELALANNCNGSITVVAASELQVASLSKAAFKRLCDESQRSLTEKIDFFSKLMGKTSKDSVARFCYGFKERHYSYGQKIFMQGQLPSEVFVVNHGEVQITNQGCNEKLGSKKGRKLSFERIANVGPYNLIGTGEVSENQPYKMTAISNSHDLVLYVIPIKEFQSLRASYKDVFERFSEKFRTQLCYFEERAEDVSSTNKKVHLPSLSGTKEIKSPKTLSRVRLSKIHDAKSIEIKPQQLSSCDLRVRFAKEKRDALDLKQETSPSRSFLTGFHADSPLYQISQLNSPTSVRGDISKQADSKERPGFGEYIDYLFSPQEKVRKRHSVRLSVAAPKESNTPRDLNNREFKIGNTLKFLAERSRLQRNSWNLPAQPTFLMENSPKAIFRNC